MPHDSDKFLHDMLDSCRFLMGFTADRTLADFVEDRGFRSAVERELQIIGEALAQLHRIAPDVAEMVEEHRRIVAFRNILVHGYHSLDHEIVWYVVRQKLPALQKQLTAMIRDRGV